MTRARPAAGPMRGPFGLFYGWYIVGVVFLGFFVNSGVSIWVFGALIKPMSEELGWSRSATVGAATLAAVTGAAVSPWVGQLVDRHGARLVMAVCAALGGGLLVAVGSMQTVWQFYLLYGLTNGAVRPGMSVLSGPTAVANWFIRRRGRAMGIVALGISVGGVVFVPLTQWVVQGWGWRTAWVALGVATWLLLVIPSLLLLRRRPEDLGLLPDGEAAATQHLVGDEARPQAPDWEAQAALRTPAFWLLLLAWGLGSMGTSSLFLLQTSSYTDRGLDAAAAASATGLFAFVGMCVKLPWGLMAERMHVRYCCIAYFVLSSLGAVAQVFVSDVPSALAAATLYGLGAGGTIQLSNQVWADYFGRRHLGAIRGNANLLQVVTQAGGPVFAAAVFDRTGSYDGAFLTFAATFAAAGLLMVLALPPRAAPQAPAELADHRISRGRRRLSPENPVGRS